MEENKDKQNCMEWLGIVNIGEKVLDKDGSLE